MIYGHEIDRGWSTVGLVCSVAMGMALGAGLGLLFAPTRGADARRSLGEATHRLRARLANAREPRVEARLFAPRAESPPGMLE